MSELKDLMSKEQVCIHIHKLHSHILSSNIAEEITEEEVVALMLAPVYIEELSEENERLRAELAERPPKLVITKLPKQDQIAKEMLEGK